MADQARDELRTTLLAEPVARPETDESRSWVPDACTLPTAEQPLRAARFDQFFASSVRAVTRPGPGRARLDLRPAPDVAARAAELAATETECCSFFTFTLTASGGALTLDVSVPAGQVAVLDALAGRAAAAAAATAAASSPDRAGQAS
jgi:hypothetical protein